LIKETRDYASFQEALAAFCRGISLREADKHFRGLYQPRLFEDKEVDK